MSETTTEPEQLITTVLIWLGNSVVYTSEG